MQEYSLHAGLKNLYAHAGGKQEVRVDGFLIDVARQDLLIEIQTGNFSALKPKLAVLLNQHRLLLVHPIAQQKWIVKYPPEGDKPEYRRKSPKKGRLEEVFFELVYIAHMMQNPNFSLEILLTAEEEIRRDDGRGSWRRKGVSIVDRRLIGVISQHIFETVDDIRSLLPLSLHDPFVMSELADELKISRRLAGKMIYSMRSMDLLKVVGKRGRSQLYTSTKKTL